MKPPVTSISGATPPCTATPPSSGSSTPAISLSRVLLPWPLPPTSPTASPGCTVNDTSRSAQNLPPLLLPFAPGLPTGAESPENMSRSRRCRRRLRLKWIPTWSASITAATQISLRTVPSSRRKTTIPATRKPIEMTAATATGVQPANSSGKNAVR